MRRVGWIVFAAIALLGAAFLSMVRIEVAPGGGAATDARSSARDTGATQSAEREGKVREGMGRARYASFGGETLSLLTVPVQGVRRGDLRSNWHDARDGGARQHTGLDIMAPHGTPVLAAADGTVEKLFLSEKGGGFTLYQRSASGDWMFYYAHLAAYAPGVEEGQAVKAGQVIAFVGDTGNAGPGNYHLHFGVSLMAPGERWHQGTPVDPYPLLAGRADGS